MTPQNTNRLSNETSPYLLQHQHNPVDWYAWGPEAFEAAVAQNKPIFLSVGYSTCYWCHVMERESFENPTVAAEMNQRFINIKVDREERPDVDQLYMIAVQALTRQGGWPMSVFLTPDLRPFYGGTYFPPKDYADRPGFVSLLRGIDDAWKNRRPEIEKSADEIEKILKHVAEPPLPKGTITIDDQFIARLIERSASDYDSRDGGFGAAPKFPRQTLLELLQIYNRTSADPVRANKIFHTLDCMAHGGIRDQLGGAFHRYSTDSQWLVPHFEIMLYDNAMLAWCYIEAYRQTEDRRYSTVTRGILDFVLREMTSPQGAFYTAFDAEVDAQEGLTYLWTRSEVEATLAESLGDEPNTEALIHRFCRVYGLDDGPNFADPHHGNGRPDKNILFLAEPNGQNVPALLDPELARLRDILLKERNQRKQPALDTKIITSWNALMIRAFAAAGAVLQERKYLDAARKAADFLMNHHRAPDGGFFRTSRDGIQKYAGFLDDHAFVIQAMITLAESGEDERWMDTAGALLQIMIRNFGDPVRGGFFFSEADAKYLIIRQKVATDSPLPSGNGVAAQILLSLEQPELAQKTIAVFARQLETQAEGMSSLVLAASQYLRDRPPIIVSPAPTENSTAPSLHEQSRAVISLQPVWESPTLLNVHVKIAESYHISGHDPANGMIATQLAVSGDDAFEVTGIEYSPASQLKVAFNEQLISAYTGEMTVRITFKDKLAIGSKVNISLNYQPCNDKACLLVSAQQAIVEVPPEMAL